MKNIEKNSKNDIISNNRHFKVILLNKIIYVWYNLSYLLIISYVWIKNINFISVYLLLSYIKYYSIIVSWYLIIICLVLKYI